MQSKLRCSALSQSVESKMASSAQVAIKKSSYSMQHRIASRRRKCAYSGIEVLVVVTRAYDRVMLIYFLI